MHSQGVQPGPFKLTKGLSDISIHALTGSATNLLPMFNKMAFGFISIHALTGSATATFS